MKIKHKPSQTEKQLNYQLYKEESIFYKMAVKQMIKSFIKKCPREILIEVLKENKIIQRNWIEKGNKYEERKC